jgi:hypothetical protein
VTEQVSMNLVIVPLFPDMTNEQIGAVVLGVASLDRHT